MLRMFDLTDRTAVVTGALGHLGPLWIKALLSAGARVAGLDLQDAPDSTAFELLVAEFGEDHGQVVWHPLDHWSSGRFARLLHVLQRPKRVQL